MSSPPTPSIVHARGLGKHELRVGDRVITPTSDRLFTLGFHLSVRAGEHIPRDELATLFWDGDDPRRSRHSLRQMLYRLRQHGFPLEEDMLAVHLPERFVDCDVREALRPGWDLQAPADQVIAGGDPIAGGPRDYTTAYQEWYDALEARVRAQLRRAALRHLSLAKLEGRWAHVEDWALHVIRHDALNEEATLARAEAMAMSGSKSRALDVLDAYLAELGDRTAQIGLPARVLRKRIAALGTSVGESHSEQLPLVGRESCTRRIAQLAGQAIHGRGSALLVTGPAGIGKTRMTKEAEDIATIAGFATIRVSGRPQSIREGIDLPLLAGLSAGIDTLPGSAGASPLAVRTVRQLAGMDTALTDATALFESPATESLLAALSELLFAAAAETAACIVIDDLHHFSDRELHHLTTIVRDSLKSRVLWVLASRIDNCPLTQSGGDAISTERLHPLTAAESTSLAEVVVRGADLNAPAPSVTSMIEIAGGNPLLLLALLRRNAVAAPMFPRADVRTLLDDILTNLPQEETLVIETVATLQRYATLGRTAAACKQSLTAISGPLETLTRRGLLKCDTGGLVTIHDAWTEAVSRRLSPLAASIRSHACSEVLYKEAVESGEAEALIHSAHLFMKCGQRTDAQEAYRQASGLLLRQGKHRLAFDAISQSISAAPGSKNAIALLPSYCLQAYRLGQFAEVIEGTARFQAALGIDEQHSSDDQLTTIALSADARWKLDQSFEHDYARLLQLLHAEAGSPDTFSLACLFAIRLALIRADTSDADKIFRLSEQYCAKHHYTAPASLVALIYRVERGPEASVRDALEHTFRMAAGTSSPSVLAMMRRYSIIALRYLGATDEAAHETLLAFDHANSTGLGSEAFQLSLQAIFLFLDEGDCDAAAQWIDRAKRLSSLFPSPERARMLLYGEARLDALSGHFQSALDRYQTTDPRIDRALMPKRTVIEQALCAYCHLRLGDSSKARATIAPVESALLQIKSALQFDCAAEYATNIKHVLDGADAAIVFAHSYLASRNKYYTRPIAKQFTELKQAQRSFEESRSS